MDRLRRRLKLSGQLLGVRPARTSSAIWRRNSGEYGRCALGIVNSFLPKDVFPTKAGQLQGSVGIVLASLPYDEADYFRGVQSFLRSVRGEDA